jgi:hypothetical protein
VSSCAMATDPGAVVLLILGFYALVSWCEELSSELCHQRGFSANLSCMSCKELKQFHLEPLIETCGQCCQHDSETQQTKQVYSFAKLVVCG